MCHVTCMTNFQKSLVPTKEWICFYCIDYLDESKARHKQKQSENLNLTKCTRSQIIIAKYWRRFVDRRFYIKIYNLIVYLQVKFRVNKRKQAFHKQVQNKLRPFHLRISKCSNLNLDLSSKRAHGKARRDSVGSGAGAATSAQQEQEVSLESHFLYIVVTVLDCSKGHLSQTWRVTSDLVSVDPASHHAAAAAGAQSNHALGQIRHHHVHHSPKHVHFDCAFLLGGVSGYQFVVLSVFQRGSFSRDQMLGQAYLDLSADMVWKRGGSFVKNLETQDFAVKDHMGADMKVDCRARPEGTIEFELRPVQGLCSGCGIIFAPCTEDLVRLVSLQGRFPGFTVPKPTGGALERRKYAVGGNSASGGYSHSAALHSKKSWVAVADGRIYMYSHFGDVLKLRINVEHFSFFATVRNKVVVYILRSPEFPDLEFYTANRDEELRWKCAFLSTFRYKQSGVMSITGADSYDTHSLIRDLALVEVNRYSGKDEQMLHFYSPTMSGGGGAISNKFVSGVVGGGGGGRKGSTASIVTSSSERNRRTDESPLKGPNNPSNNPNNNPNNPSNPHHSPAGNKNNSSQSPQQLLPSIVPSPNSISSPAQRPPAMLSVHSSASITSTSSCSSLGESASGQSTSTAATGKATGAGAGAGSNLRNSGGGGGGPKLTKLGGRTNSTISSCSNNPRSILKKGVFAEIDEEIAHIQEVKSKYRHEYKEDRRKRAISTADSKHSAASAAAGGEGGTGSGTGGGTSRHVVTLQGVREQVSDLFEAEENALNDQINSVGANFVTRILTAMKQKKMH